jgi:hypothetical protein
MVWPMTTQVGCAAFPDGHWNGWRAAIADAATATVQPLAQNVGANAEHVFARDHALFEGVIALATKKGAHPKTRALI